MTIELTDLEAEWLLDVLYEELKQEQRRTRESDDELEVSESFGAIAIWSSIIDKIERGQIKVAMKGG